MADAEEIKESIAKLSVKIEYIEESMKERRLIEDQIFSKLNRIQENLSPLLSKSQTRMTLTGAILGAISSGVVAGIGYIIIKSISR